MNKKQYKEETLNLIKRMENNTFLLPDSWSSEITMSSGNWYKTYVGARGVQRYINIEIKNIKDDNKIAITFRGESILLEEEDVFGKRISPENVYNSILEVYKEKHSFVETSEGRKSIIDKIKNLKQSISLQNKEYIKLQKELKDYETLKK